MFIYRSNLFKAMSAIFFLPFVFMLLCGFWGIGEKKKEKAPLKVKVQSVKITPTKNDQRQAANIAAVTPSTDPEKTKTGAVSGDAVKKAENEQPKTNTDVKKIQSELKEIVTRTQNLQRGAVQDRSDIQRILERARIHERILRNLTAPKLVNQQAVNTDEILRQEKLKIIARETEKSQKLLRNVEASNAIEQVIQTQKLVQIRSEPVVVKNVTRPNLVKVIENSEQQPQSSSNKTEKS